MVNEQVIERLKKGDWYVECKAEQDADLVLQACDEARIKWRNGYKATEYKPYNYPVDIGFYGEDNRITHTIKYFKKSENENITNWFFNAIKNNDSKLIPQNEEQEHLVQMLLAKLQGIPVEYWSTVHYKWLDSKHDAITASAIYRIKPTFNQETSLTERPEDV
ncbi:MULTISPECIES: hypothetical protein [unclassified Gilliamella]|uniref:hypothetical protein n=1 Tax=unclassified Gilliamella TaxID=2685620 RepID=UPI000A34A008|nr:MULTISPECIES: hypothetical protein [unclassified Gilliamella]OTQ74732.1 hypothetical protein B6C99_02965 [Gilliamella sp. N-G2]OTQ79448.1 hypothetical protein B6D23_05290 [Gilliamella sp. N-W3]